ncbi:MAG: TauD/TfdA dioxygenase family protein [Betaproteobacteria bacterium]|nr:TauD/TfdA family dioxygenase [Betaproteobacteria bacterium]
MKIIPGSHSLGATVTELDLSQPLTDTDHRLLVEALANRGVLRFPNQTLTARQQFDFSARFGTLEENVAGMFQEPGLPQVMVLSNIVRDGKPIGIADAGQSWHTDMSYSATVAYANVLYAIEIPQRAGRPLGSTQFADMVAAYETLPNEIKRRIAGRTATHDFAKFWDMMRRERGSARPALTDAQRNTKPPVSHPLVLVHPVSGQRALYANPGYAMWIDGMDRSESDELLAFLFQHQTESRFVFTFEWTRGDVLMWDNLRTIHQALADYRADEPRLIKRCQVMADRVLNQGRTDRHALAAV